MRSQLKAVDAVCMELRSFMLAHGLVKKSFAMELIVRECLNNAILHGNRLKAAKKVFLDLRLGRRWLRLQIADEGVGFDWRKARGVKADITATSGRGFSIVKSYTDRVSYNQRGNKITLWVDKCGSSKRN